MKEDFNVSISFRILTGILVLFGIAGFTYGFITQPERTWANYLINNFYFLSLALGGTFFYVIQYITRSGWSSGFKRIPEAFMAYLPFAAVFFLLLYFGTHSLYHWTHEEELINDPLLAHKTPWLNTPFFMIRIVLYFSLWILLTQILRRFSVNEDKQGGMIWFIRSEYYSRVLVFVLLITFTLASIDWIMSLSPHWYSTIFAVKQLISAFLHGVSIIVLIIFILHRKGFFPFMNKYHRQDMTRYIFMLSIIWGYFWFAQFMLIWYGNIPEETLYYYIRWKEGWKTLFFLEIIFNWAVPFFILLPIKASRNPVVMSVVIIFLVVGQYVEQYLQVFPQLLDTIHFGFIEITTFLGYAGLFTYVVISSLGRRKIIPVNHPYLQECTEHHF